MQEEDTIAGIASGLAPAGIGVIRLSGGRAVTIAEAVFRALDGAPLRAHLPREMVYGAIQSSGEVLDRGLAVWFEKPHSYTGEDVVEFHCHGNPLILRKVTTALCRAGARAAEPGEFTKRAFLNGRMDLSQAEAVATLVFALTERAQIAALRNMEGALSREVRQVRVDLLSVLAALEVVVDYAEDQIEEMPTEHLRGAIQGAIARLDRLVASFAEGRILKEGATVALAGKPNVGKSSLLNRIAGEERAIVSPVPGTTRDYIESWVKLGGLPVRLVDTAGLRESTEPVEALGTSAAEKVVRSADLVLFIVDGSEELTSDDATAYARVKDLPHIIVINKRDLGLLVNLRDLTRTSAESVSVSALTGDGLPGLMERMQACLLGGAGLSTAGAIIMEARQSDLAGEAIDGLVKAGAALAENLPREFVQVGLRSAVSALSRITGDEITEDLLDRIFSTFCVGK
jgi:tRNA modification GTPase